MSVSTKILYGDTLDKILPPQKKTNYIVKLPGTYKGKPTSFEIDTDTLSKHSLFIGGTGCGKTTLFYHFISQIRSRMTSDDVMIIFDSKGDFYSKFGNDKDYVLGNSSQYSSRSVKWNIFREILADGFKEKDYLLNIQEICNSFFAERIQKSQNTFFPHAAADLLSAIITTLIRDSLGSKEIMNETFYNDTLRVILDGSTVEDLINNIESYSDLISVVSYINGEGSQTQGVLSEMYSVVKEIFIGVFSERGAFSIRDFVRSKGGKTLFIEYDLSIGSILSPIYSLLFDLALKEALGQSSNRKGNVYLICDEFRLLPNLKHIDDGVNFGRSLGVKVFAGLQSINQLIEVYGEARGKNIAAGFSSVYAFRANDTATRKFVIDLYGQNYILDHYSSVDKKYMEDKRQGNTVEDWDMMSLNVGEAIVGLPFSKPFRFQFANFK
ncbi:type IV secretory system conjugative DNA transfer family protein [Ruminococcus callidus]|jgi:type IV secretory pathway TraG/TraD family ATPase VirD4|uniref:type IV secretory system conjugative DNA transfer family protein n=1 Tax=Ruminococcus callidus TaxID=40519 RepID=UPI0035221373